MARPLALLVAAAVVAVILGTTATTGALWRTAATIDAGAITAGTLSLLNGNASTQAQEYAFSALSGTDLGPGSYRQAPLTIVNDGDIAVRYRLGGVGYGTLTGQASYTATRVASEAGCPATGSPTALAGDVTVKRTLAPAASEVWCLRVTLGTAPPQNLSPTPVVFSFLGEQARHVD